MGTIYRCYPGLAIFDSWLLARPDIYGNNLCISVEEQIIVCFLGLAIFDSWSLNKLNIYKNDLWRPFGEQTILHFVFSSRKVTDKISEMLDIPKGPVMYVI